MSTTTPNHVHDLALAEAGVRRIEWADRQMPVLRQIRERFETRAPARGHARRRLPARHHRDREPDAHAARPAAPSVALCASNPLSTQDDVAAALVAEYGISVYAVNGEDNETLLRAHRRRARTCART